MHLDTVFVPFTKIILKGIIDLNVKCKTIRILEGNREENLGVLVFDKNF